MRIYTILIQLIAGVYFIYAVPETQSEKSRPYEFGFNIEGYQHRHESKDEKGIVMGEFGFITADGVYHVTAYATDENGRFKILFMKNIKIGLPGNQSSVALQLPRKPPAESITTTPPPKQQIRKLSLQRFDSDTRACSGCAIPSAIQRNREIISNQPPRNSDISPGVADLAQGKTPSDSRQYTPNSKSSDNELLRPASVASPNQRRNPTSFKSSLDQMKKSGSFESDNDRFDVSRGKAQPNFTTRKNKSNDFSMDSPKGRILRPKNEKAKTINASKGSKQSPYSRKIQDQENSSQELALNSPKEIKQNGRTKLRTNDGVDSKRSSLSKIGIDLGTLEEMRRGLSGLLYKFNYTVGYHGHHEKGDFKGVKDGGYHFVGRDGLRRNIEYIANDFGYQPYLTQDQVTGSEVPRVETEKEAGLKGYEFKWFSERE